MELTYVKNGKYKASSITAAKNYLNLASIFRENGFDIKNDLNKYMNCFVTYTNLNKYTESDTEYDSERNEFVYDNTLCRYINGDIQDEVIVQILTDIRLKIIGYKN